MGTGIVHAGKLGQLFQNTLILELEDLGGSWDRGSQITVQGQEGFLTLQFTPNHVWLDKYCFCLQSAKMQSSLTLFLVLMLAAVGKMFLNESQQN